MDRNRNSNLIPGVSNRSRSNGGMNANYLNYIASSNNTSGSGPNNNKRKLYIFGGIFVVLFLGLAIFVLLRKGANSAPDAGGEIAAQILNERILYKDEINCALKDGGGDYDRVAATDFWTKFTILGLKDKDGNKTDVRYTGGYVYVAYFDDYNHKDKAADKSYYDSISGFEHRYGKTLPEILSVSDENTKVKCSSQNEGYYKIPFVGSYRDGLDEATTE